MGYRPVRDDVLLGSRFLGGSGGLRRLITPINHVTYLLSPRATDPKPQTVNPRLVSTFKRSEYRRSFLCEPGLHVLSRLSGHGAEACSILEDSKSLGVPSSEALY